MLQNDLTKHKTTLQHNMKSYKTMLGQTDNIVIMQNNIIRNKTSL